MTHNTKEEWEDEFEKMYNQLSYHAYYSVSDDNDNRRIIKDFITSQRHQERESIIKELLKHEEHLSLSHGTPKEKNFRFVRSEFITNLIKE